MRRSHRPGADHRHRVVEADVDVLVPADRIGQRVGEGGLLVGQSVRHSEQVLQRDLGDRDELGVGALVVEAHQLVLHAEVLVAASAQPAAPAPQRGDAVHVVAHLEAGLAHLAVRLGPDLDHLAADLVTQHPRGRDATVAVEEDAHVRSADPARRHA